MDRVRSAVARAALWIAAATTLAATATRPRPARAQSCHPPAFLAPSRLGLRTWLSSEIASYETRRYEGSYQSTALGLDFRHEWLRVRAALPAYRIDRNGLVTH